MAWFVRDVWQADDDSEWAERLTEVLDELAESGHELVAATSHAHESGPLGRPGTRFVLFFKLT